MDGVFFVGFVVGFFWWDFFLVLVFGVFLGGEGCLSDFFLI